MSYLALYRKYRPIDFDSVFGQEEVVRVIKNSILNNRISHAYLFSGPRGTGKTTVAKIIARLVNCENLVDSKPCGKCYNCLHFNNSNDIVEIDAASNNGVDEIRELKDKVNFVPTNAKYKVYIIDEVHMLTTQAFNALLKTLEEPPSHVIFILATTEPSKIPLTISSRCQKFRFSKISDEKIVDRLKEIAKLENIEIDEDALFEIARLSDGGMRDSINMLDQLTSYCSDKITLNDVYTVNGSVSYEEMFLLLSYIAKNDKVNIINFINNLDNSGKEINKFMQELLIFLKDVILYKNTGVLSNVKLKNKYIIDISDLYADTSLYNLIEKIGMEQNVVRNSTHGTIVFLAFILNFSDCLFSNADNEIISREINEDKNENISREIKRDDVNDKNKNKEDMKKENKNISREIKNNKKLNDAEIDRRINNAFATASKSFLNDIKEKWSKIDDYISDDKFSIISGVLRDFTPVMASDSYIVVSNSLTSLVDRLNDNIEIVQSLLMNILGYDLLVVGITDDRWNSEKTKYIENIKSGKKYFVRGISHIDNNNVKKNNSVDDLIGLVGNNVIEYK